MVRHTAFPPLVTPTDKVVRQNPFVGFQGVRCGTDRRPRAIDALARDTRSCSLVAPTVPNPPSVDSSRREVVPVVGARHVAGPQRGGGESEFASNGSSPSEGRRAARGGASPSEMGSDTKPHLVRGLAAAPIRLGDIRPDADDLQIHHDLITVIPLSATRAVNAWGSSTSACASSIWSAAATVVSPMVVVSPKSAPWTVTATIAPVSRSTGERAA